MIPDTPKTLLRKIAEYANGDDAAEWERFVELYTPVIRAYASMREDVNESDADDVVQEIFVRLVNVLRTGTYRPEKGRFRAYLGTMVRRLLIDRHRRALARGAGREVPVDDVELLAETPDVAEYVDRRLAEARHDAAVEHVLSRTMLDARTVAAYRAYALEGEAAAEVASRLDLTVNALRQIKYRVGRMISAVDAQYGE
ncbi:MAG: sigma-70 family RNA polymerase sigma factor [Kiritimatiellae bacterium]|jgi:RNA polymerase sigma-70 factor (ECF subfamily)|nr:sigma-70 family RNA polymerase sigma factor [Kiritimatiellia bacterium]